MAKPTGTKVGIRVKPADGKSCVELQKKITVISDPRGRDEDFSLPISFAFTEKNSNKQVSDSLLSTIISKSLEGHDACVLAWGASNTGKTHSITGKDGLVTSVFKALFAAVDNNLGITLFATLSAVMFTPDGCQDLILPTWEPKVETHPVIGVKITNAAEIAVLNPEDGNLLVRQIDACRNGTISLHPAMENAPVLYTVFVSCETAMGDNTTSEIVFADLPSPSAAKGPSPVAGLTEYFSNKCKTAPATDGVTQFVSSFMAHSLVVILAHVSPLTSDYTETVEVLQCLKEMQSVKRIIEPNRNVRQRLLRSLTAEAQDSDADQTGLMRLISDVRATTNDDRLMRSRQQVELRAMSLRDAGVLELVQDVARQDHEAMRKKLGELMERRKEVMDKYTKQKDEVAKARKAVEGSVATYNSIVSHEGPASSAARSAMKAVDKARQTWKSASTPLQELKDAQKSLMTETVEVEESLAKTESFIDNRHDPIDIDLDTIRKEGAEHLAAEKKRLWEEAEEAKNALKAKVSGQSENDTVTLADHVELQLQLIQLKADKNFLVSRLSVANNESQHMERHLAEMEMKVATDAEERQLSHIMVFRQYRLEHEARFREYRKKAQDAIDELSSDAKKLADRNRTLRGEIAKLKAVGELKKKPQEGEGKKEDGKPPRHHRKKE
ncbi:Kinesin motor domain [Carpediemonas membranifera]|uniref:Kinesin motor domain n=1 Tax=Carpediemonas membranifera TaxID=201153 RepID=A0A8J6B0L8_9EUKA|nr:Kinesin motor domain [Carpediemonas membranifera]|eukprot:KAG9391714.1 Kinesin motor domain [Carpediemonas membranifera]